MGQHVPCPLKNDNSHKDLDPQTTIEFKVFGPIWVFSHKWHDSYLAQLTPAAIRVPYAQQTDTQTTEHATGVAIGRIYAMQPNDSQRQTTCRQIVHIHRERLYQQTEADWDIMQDRDSTSDSETDSTST